MSEGDIDAKLSPLWAQTNENTKDINSLKTSAKLMEVSLERIHKDNQTYSQNTARQHGQMMNAIEGLSAEVKTITAHYNQSIGEKKGQADASTNYRWALTALIPIAIALAGWLISLALQV